ncbi:MAG: contractile injection system tape measure protein [Mucilaginibacter sp.]|uniref:contractile injection system tape measure protein n=1 Tax=Mucilaginibacter sp. TaxID=1882438 RepID=UPI0032643C7C
MKPISPQRGISVHNAGCVLLSTYFPMLFERLGLMANHSFLNEEAQQQAVHYLQYVVTGLSSTEESLLPLNKVLCGLPIAQPIIQGINISEEHIDLINGLINAAMGYWPAIGSSSVDGFRGNWLVRDGLLTEHGDKWELTVEKRAYDLLIHRSPFSFSIIKYPWMDKPLHVTWPY